jgi:redox-sensitive bicupin YhaK (pirin superfamily)
MSAGTAMSAQPSPHIGRPRAVARVVAAQSLLEGGGFPVRRPFPSAALPQIDPFLLLDEMGPVDWAPGQAIGAPDHPHRGFETVTYLLAGRMRHRDSHGHSADLGPGDAQWMTAGAGVVHSEMPHPDLLAAGGRVHGFQLWVNLPAADKLMPPRYQDLPAVQIPTAHSQDGTVAVRVIAGAALGVHAAIDTRIPITYLHFTLQPGARHWQPLTRGHNAFAYLFAGEASLGGPPLRVGAGQAALLGDGDGLELAVPPEATAAAELLLLAGPPLGEPVARYGPFVMNTHAEIVQAIRDYQTGRMGAIPPETDE